MADDEFFRSCNLLELLTYRAAFIQDLRDAQREGKADKWAFCDDRIRMIDRILKDLKEPEVKS